MKFKIKYILSVVTLGVMMLTSCKRDLLNPKLETDVSDATAFDQPYRISNQVLSLYAAFKAGTFYGGRFLVYGDIRANDFLSEDPNLVTNADVWGMNPNDNANAVVGLWNQAFFTINSCNVFIDGMNTKGLTVVGTALGNNYIAEARLIRAISFYSLLQYYTRPYADGAGSKLGLPLRLVGIKGAGSSDLARSTVAQVYTQILDDLNFAETNLPVTNSNAFNNTTRAHRNTAIAFKTRVYLSMQDYPKVISEANKIVPAVAPFVASSGVPHALQADITNVFKTPYTTVESIFSVPFTTTAGDIPGTQNGLQSYYFNTATGSGSIFSLNPAGIIADVNWKATDKRRDFLYTSTSGANAGKVYLRKFPTAAPADYSPVIRWAEVLLNLAEAKVRSTNTLDAQSLALLNAVRFRSDATTILAPATAADLLTAISHERRIEFLGEGLRNNEILRLLGTFPGKGTVGAVGPTNDGYIWPVPNTERSLNKLWVD